MDDARVLEREPDDIVASGQAWRQQVDSAIATALIGVIDVQSVFHRLDIAGWTGAIVDDETLAEIEWRLMKRFEL